ncbi:unnamed protein product [Lactuca virosa]|uniref:Uncharacterized protein n=1 Tax=Lactuca virosa TaxID=75947 RepID=A0AAU9PSZ4_9ASTR|nr:unnamed protein product [Lactuca virosa]
MQFGDLANRDPDPAPELVVAEHDVIKRLIAYYLIWSNPDESTICLANLDNTYGAPIAVLVPNLRGDDLSLLERLHRKRRSIGVKVGSSSNPKSDPSFDADARGESETILDFVIPNSPMKSIGLTYLSSKSTHSKRA